MVLQGCPSISGWIASRSTVCCRSGRHLRQVHVEPLFLKLLKLFLLLHSTRPALQTLSLYFCLTDNNLAVPIRLSQARQRVCERLKICSKLLVRTPPLLNLRGRLLNFADKSRVFDCALVFFGRREERIIGWRGESDLWTGCAR